MELPKKIEKKLSYNAVVALLAIYPENTKILIQRDTCTLVFIAALFTLAKLWKQPKCPLIGEWIKKWCVCVYIVQYYSAIKRNVAICNDNGWS